MSRFRASVQRHWTMRLLAYARPEWPRLLLLILLMSMSAIGVALQPWPLKIIIDEVLTNRSTLAAEWLAVLPGAELTGNMSRVAILAWIAALTILLGGLAEAVVFARNYVSLGVHRSITRRLRSDLLAHLQRQSGGFFRQYRTGDLIQRTARDSQCVNDLVLKVGLSRVMVLVRLIIMFAIMWRLDALLATIVLLSGVPLAAISRRLSRTMTERTTTEQRIGGEMTSFAEQTLTALPLVKGFDRERAGDRRFADVARRSLHAALRLTESQLQFRLGTGAVKVACQAIIMMLGAFRVLDGTMSVGTLLVFLAYLTSLMEPMEGLAHASIGFAAARAGATRVFEVLDYPQEVMDAPGARPLPARRAGTGVGVRWERVVFGYEAGRPVLHGVDLDVRPGERVALVGATGAGKSTLVSLVPRFFDPWEGRVLVDGVDVRTAQLASVRAQVGLLLQRPFLLPMSIADNIAYGRPDATRAEVEAAARAAQAHEFIARLPKGYETVVGERGSTLSGGEKQRLAIARALLKDAPILVLDEPTSALDVETEAALLRALERLMAGRTVLVIAHRLSTVRHADRIVVLQNGRIAEIGTHDELLTAGGAYHMFHQLTASPQTPVGVS